MNKFVFTGRLTADPETKQVKDMKVTTFSIAVGRGYSKEVDFIDITTWKQTAENCSKFLSKGSMVLCDGRVQKRSYDSKEGKKVYVFDFIADNVEFLNRVEKKQEEVEDDDLPF
jgi:single-strand DNA-binding protein